MSHLGENKPLLQVNVDEVRGQATDGDDECGFGEGKDYSMYGQPLQRKRSCSPRRIRRRPSTPRECQFVSNVGLEEWNDMENLSNTRGEVIIPDISINEGGKTGLFSWRILWAYAGPGWLMSISYVDPGNLESDLQAGAYAGYQLIWVLFWATSMGFILQVLAARLGVVTGKNLAEMCRLSYPRWASLTLWVMTEIAIVASDIQEVLGSAIAFRILFGLPLWAGCLVTGIDTLTFLLLHKFGIRKLEAFFITLIGVMLFCFVGNFVQGGVEAKHVALGFIPRVHSYATTQAVGILGAVIMPHNIFLHSALVQSRAVDRRKPEKVREANKYFSIEAGGALFISFLINLAVLGVFAKGFFSQDCVDSFKQHGLNTACLPSESVDPASSYGACTLANGIKGLCSEIGLSQAGRALSGMLGGYAETIWAIGLLAAGQSSTMTGTYAGQFVMEGFLRLRLSPWRRVALTRCVALIPALSVAILSENHPSTSDHMDELLNVLQSIQLPFALIPVLHFTSDTELMGSFANGRVTKVVCWILSGVIVFINLYLVSIQLKTTSFSTVSYILMSVLGMAYFSFLSYLIHTDVYALWSYLHETRRS